METLASEMLKELKLQAKRWFWAFITVLLLWFATIGGFVWFLNQYNFSSETTEYTQDGQGLNIIGDENGVNYGADTESY